MAGHNILGVEGEQYAVSYLKKKGYQILETNWRCRKREIDIIARSGNTVIIAEVKTRKTDYFGLPEESVTLTKQKYLIDAADQYLQELEYEAEVRFDIITVIKNKTGIEINHIEDAFIPLAE